MNRTNKNQMNGQILDGNQNIQNKLISHSKKNHLFYMCVDFLYQQNQPIMKLLLILILEFFLLFIIIDLLL